MILPENETFYLVHLRYGGTILVPAADVLEAIDLAHLWFQVEYMQQDENIRHQLAYDNLAFEPLRVVPAIIDGMPVHGVFLKPEPKPVKTKKPVAKKKKPVRVNTREVERQRRSAAAKAAWERRRLSTAITASGRLNAVRPVTEIPEPAADVWDNQGD